jgi:hypothetical protein
MSWNQADAPLLIESFPNNQECDLKHLGLVDLIGTKQTNKQTNKQPCFIDRYVNNV